MAIVFNLDMDGSTPFEVLVTRVARLAEGRNVEILSAVRSGPGGGNPNFEFEAPSEEAAFGLVDDLYGPEAERGDESNRFYVYGET